MTHSSDRYNRQIILKGFGIESQNKLAAAKVVVIGAGGLGCASLPYLAAAGIGTIGIVENDVVDLSNLQRQVLYKTGDVGRQKIDIAIQNLQQLNLDITLRSHPVRLTQHNALDILAQYDIVVDGTDNFETRYLVNDACVLLKKPLVWAAVSEYEGQVAVWNVPDENGHRLNYRNLFPRPPENGAVRNCAEAGVLGALVGIIGNMQAAEAIKLITGIGTPLINRLLTYNVLTHDVYVMEIPSGQSSSSFLPKTAEEFRATNYEAACAAPQAKGITSINGETLLQLATQPSTIVIDVREVYEQPKLSGFPFQQIPMSELKELLPTITADHVVFVCQHGARSQTAARWMQELAGNSKTVFSLEGGVAKWKEQLLS